MPPVLTVPAAVLDDIVAQALDEAPLECCGLLAGELATGVVHRYLRCRNAAASARVYTVEPRDQLRATRNAEDDGLDIIWRDDSWAQFRRELERQPFVSEQREAVGLEEFGAAEVLA